MQDDDGTGYVFYASEWNGRIRAARLDLDMANVQQHFADILWGVSREAPVIFKAHDHYFMLVSGDFSALLVAKFLHLAHHEIWKHCQTTSKVQAQVLPNLRVWLGTKVDADVPPQVYWNISGLACVL